MNITLKPLPEYGNLMTLREFIKSVEAGYFIDYDGHGYYATKKGMSDFIVRPSDIAAGFISKDFTHVMWFNR